MAEYSKRDRTAAPAKLKQAAPKAASRGIKGASIKTGPKSGPKTSAARSPSLQKIKVPKPKR